MQYLKITTLTILLFAFVGNIQGQSKKELVQRLNNLEEKMATTDSNNKLLLDSLATIKEQVKEMDSNIQMLNDKIGQLATMVEGLSEEVKKANKVNQNKGGGVTQIPKNLTSLVFEKDTFNFDEIKEGKVITHIYKFTNTGKKALKIENARGSCGCTVPEWPKEEIAPGKTGEIKVVFNSRGKRGPQHKTVSITANTDPIKSVIHITGIVTAAE